MYCSLDYIIVIVPRPTLCFVKGRIWARVRSGYDHDAVIGLGCECANTYTALSPICYHGLT